MARDSAELVTRFDVCLLFPKELVHNSDSNRQLIDWTEL